jgi:hypothetical protein
LALTIDFGLKGFEGFVVGEGSGLAEENFALVMAMT